MNFDQYYHMDKLVDYLRGSCETLDTACNTFDIDCDDLTDEELQFIYDRIFLCNGCNWWCEVSEQAPTEEDLICTDCWNEEYDEEYDEEYV